MPTLPAALLPLLLVAPGLLAQTPKPTQDELLEAKLASPFLKNAPWGTDYEKALDAAKAQHRLVLAYFTTVNH